MTNIRLTIFFDLMNILEYKKHKFTKSINDAALAIQEHNTEVKKPEEDLRKIVKSYITVMRQKILELNIDNPANDKGASILI